MCVYVLNNLTVPYILEQEGLVFMCKAFDNATYSKLGSISYGHQTEWERGQTSDLTFD